MNDNNTIKKILILAANPKNSTHLRLDEELREIDAGLTRAKQRDRFELLQKWAVRPRDVQRAILELAPQIVHFSGHGLGEDGLVFEDEGGVAKLVSTEAIAGLFELFADQVECVVLNACWSEVQAKAIAKHIPHVIGMNHAVGDLAAREFAVGFYDALGAGRGIRFAYKYGCNSIRMAGIPEHLTPMIEPKDEAGPMPDSPPDALEEVGSVKVDLEELGGQVPLASLFYVERPPIEARCYEAIVKPGALVRVKAPRQMGKSSLTIRILDHAEKQGYYTTWLNLQSAGEQALSSLDRFLKWLCDRVTKKLRLPNKVEEYWQGVSGSPDKCTDYFELYLLEELTAPLALCLDEVDEIFNHPAIASDFFGLLRSWHEESKINPVWRNLRLVITHSEEVYIPLNINQSPFNVGVPIELPPFSQMQLGDLAVRHGLRWSVEEVESVMRMVGGHPFLTRMALQEIANGSVKLTEFLQVSPTQEWLLGNHLRRHLGNLEERNLVKAMKQVIASEKPVRLPIAEASKLANMGLIRFHGNDAIVLCDLYRQYFREVLGGVR